MATGRENGSTQGGHHAGEMNRPPDHHEAEIESVEQMQELMERAREEIDHYVDRACEVIRERPLVSVGGALALGWLIGRLASGR